MPIYAVQQYEIHLQTYHVPGDDPAHAVSQLWAGAGVAVPGSREFLEVGRDYGITRDVQPELYDAVAERYPGLVEDERIAAIRSIELIPDEPACRRTQSRGLVCGRKRPGKRYRTIGLDELAGKTIEGVTQSRTGQDAFGRKPLTTLYFTDGTRHGFLHPAPDE
jgi:hypothetical protein